jgi:hypothetical protein
MNPLTAISPGPAPGARVAAGRKVEPFLHVEPQRLYNPLTDASLRPEDLGYATLRAAALDGGTVGELLPAVREQLLHAGWLVEEDGTDLATRFYLKYVSLEAHSACNQGCYFCPVSSHRRETYFMPLDFYEDVARQLAKFRATIEGVSMINYNEPTLDKRFVEQVAILLAHGLPPAVLTNATGLTPARVDAIVKMGGLKYLSVNLSTLDRERYKADRRGDHVKVVMKNLEYVRDVPLAKTMEIAVLGQGDAVHKRDFEEITAHFAGSRFTIKYYEVMDRAGIMPVGLRPGTPLERLCGCEQTGSRPLQWVHVTAHGKAVLCCQDYFDRYVIGDLHEQPLEEILAGPEMATLRRWVYGLEEAPRDFLCRNCVYALTR